MRYETLLSQPLREFIAETATFHEPGIGAEDWAAQRQAYDRMAAHFHQGRPEGLVVTEDRHADVPLRRYGAPSPVTILFVHGGGFVLGGLESHDDLCAELAQRSGCQLVAAHYRLAPEHPHPAAYDDVVAVAAALCAEGPVVLVGDSAGATLCAALAGTRADLGIRGQVLIYPWLGSPPVGDSFEAHAHAPMLARDDLTLYDRALGGAAEDPRRCPIRGDLARLPPTRLFAADCDPLCDDAGRYAAAARGQGARDIAVTVQAGLVHGWLRARHRSPALRAEFEAIVAALLPLCAAAVPPGR